MFIDVFNIIQQLNSDGSTLAKEKILSENKDNPLLRQVLYLTYSPTINFYTKYIPSVSEAKNNLQNNEYYINSLYSLVRREYTGNAAKQFLSVLFSIADAETQYVMSLIIGRDLRCGVNTKLINRVFPGLIEEYDFMLADTDKDHIKYPAISQLKADGMRASISKEDGRIVVMSRGGKTVDHTKEFADAFIECLTDGVTLDGELLCVVDDLNILDRKTSNGILNKAIQGTATNIELSSVRFFAWDVVDKTGTIPYEQRYYDLQNIIAGCKFADVIETVFVENEAEALKHFKDCRKRGQEGTIVKNKVSKWVPKRSKDLCKFKAEVEAEFRVVGYELGTGKNKGRIGNILIESECGRIKCSVGIFKDMPEEVRDEWLIEDNMPSIVTVMFNERITSKNSDTQSLFLPRITQARYDKNVADTLESIIEIEKAILED